MRIEDVAIGCAVSLVVGLLFWPRGAAAALRTALAEAYVDSARYLARAVEYGLAAATPATPRPPPPADAATRARRGARRLDDAFRGYLAERGAKQIPLAEVTRLVTGVAGLRLAADAVLDLWRREDGPAAATGRRRAARLLAAGGRVRVGTTSFAESLDRSRVPEPLAQDDAGDGGFWRRSAATPGTDGARTRQRSE